MMTKKEVINEITNEEGRFDKTKTDVLIDYLHKHFIGLLDSEDFNSVETFNKLIRKTHSCFISLSNKISFGIPDNIWIKFFDEKIIKLKINHFPDLESKKNELYSLSNKKLHNRILNDYGDEILFISVDCYYPNSTDVFNLYYTQNRLYQQMQEIQETVSTEMRYIEYSAYNILYGRLKKIKYSVDNTLKKKLKTVNIKYNVIAKSIYNYLKYIYPKYTSNKYDPNEEELTVLTYYFMQDNGLFNFLKDCNDDNKDTLYPIINTPVANHYQDADDFKYGVFNLTKDQYKQAMEDYSKISIKTDE